MLLHIVSEDHYSTTKMDMGTSTMNMVTMTSTSGAASATSSVSMSMGGDSSCKISMLWNWNTLDSCFIASSWHITSNGMFAGSCIGVVLLVMSLEFLRRASREYDRYLVIQAQLKQQHINYAPASFNKNESTKAAVTTITSAHSLSRQFRPSIFQQLIRALLHMVQFAVAYFVMLLAMYYNGYIIISIFIGAFLGAFVFSWEAINLGPDGKEEATICCG